MEPLSIWQDVYQVGGYYISNFNDCSIYLLNGGKELALIDSGVGTSFEKVVKNIEILGFSPENIKYVIATHAHIDHIGGLSKFKHMFNSIIIAHTLDTDKIEKGVDVGAEYYGVNYDPCTVDIKIDTEHHTLHVGKHELKLIHIPGHTPGSIACYVDVKGKRVLFGQDIHGPYSLPGSNPEKARISLKKLIELESDILCEGHFGVYKPKHKVKNYIESWLAKI
ncbi:MAG: MBL fold metallo-hydrolase [Deltaproteobacteria bacterium]|nr:MBL fold metallo-hydrolase [Deltaproteobacteria bacterium]